MKGKVKHATGGPLIALIYYEICPFLVFHQPITGTGRHHFFLMCINFYLFFLPFVLYTNRLEPTDLLLDVTDAFKGWNMDSLQTVIALMDFHERW
jgi:hypothetical protein